MILLFEIDFLIFIIFRDFPNCFNFDRFPIFFCFFKGVEIKIDQIKIKISLKSSNAKQPKTKQTYRWTILFKECHQP